MIKELIYLIIILLGIPAGLFLAKICKEEIKNWRKRLKILIAGCFVVIVAVFFLDFEYKISTCAENIENIEKIYSLIRKHRPDASIIMTLSPVGIRATWREVGSVVANTVSKATLRVALDEVHRKHSVVDKKFFYLPSYEIVREFGSVSETFKSFQDNFRHPPTDTVLLIMEFFRKYFIVKE